MTGEKRARGAYRLPAGRAGGGGGGPAGAVAKEHEWLLCTNAMYKAVTLGALLAGCALHGTILLGQAQPPPRPGVKTPGVKIPIERLKPEAVYEVTGNPDWLALDPVNNQAWVSNEPKNTVYRLDPKSNTFTTLTVGKAPCSGLAADFGSRAGQQAEGQEFVSGVERHTAGEQDTSPHILASQQLAPSAEGGVGGHCRVGHAHHRMNSAVSAVTARRPEIT